MFNINKYILYGILTFIAITVLTSAILLWRKDIRDSALQDFNNKQLQVILEEQKKFTEILNALKKIQEQAIKDLEAKNIDLSNKLKEVEAYLDSADAKKDDRASSMVLKRTIENLKRQKP